jgi:hypothetical protein
MSLTDNSFGSRFKRKTGGTILQSEGNVKTQDWKQLTTHREGQFFETSQSRLPDHVNLPCGDCERKWYEFLTKIGSKLEN